ncbi:MAG: methyltransferase domain-containing protein [Paracoccaceae bacterium]|nr:methyltransferase domain-containing protein [Paracoccaceae bacterium]
MSNTDAVFRGSIPEFYDSYMVPLIFEPYARDLADRVARLAPKSVLETAAGTGVVPRALVRRLPAGVRYVVTDLNEPMLAFAAGRQPEDRRIEWRWADALDLPFEDAGFDVVICQFGAMFFPDRSRGFAEARRVLRPGGRYLFSVWDRIGTNEFTDVITEVLGAYFPADPPRFMVRTPHGYHDEAVIRSDLARAGFDEVSIEGIDAVSRAPSAWQVARAFCQGTPLRSEIEARDPAGLERVTAIVAEALEARYGMGEVEAGIRAHVVTAVK